jgi:inorganic triphosphatase YgiF
MRKDRLNLYFDPATTRALDELAARRKVSKSAIAEAAVASFLSPDGADRREAAFSRRLDRLTRQVERLERDQTITVEALGLFIRAWLTATPALPPSAQQAAQDKGRERYENFLETLARRVQHGRNLAKEVSEDIRRTDNGQDAEVDHASPGSESSKS